MARFKTNQQIAEEKSLENRAKYAEEKRVADERKKVLDAQFNPIIERVEPKLRTIWKEFATARELRGNTLARLREGYGFSLSYESGHGYALEFKLLTETVAGLRGIERWRQKYPNYELDEFAQAIHDETGIEVRVLEYVERYHDSDYGWVPADERISFTSVAKVKKPSRRSSKKTETISP